MSLGQITTAIDGAIGTIMIDNLSRHNAVNRAMWLAIPQAVSTLSANEHVRVIVLRGAGDGAFISGADISEFDDVRKDAASSRAYEAANGAAFRALRTCEKPTIAMIRRFCMGGGVGLAVACDLRVAGDDSLFALPPGRLGLAYPIEAMKDMVDLIGASATKDLYFTARRFDAAEALLLGLLNRVVPATDLEFETRALAEVIAANAPLTLRAVKATVEGHRLGGQADWARIKAICEACFDSEDYAEGRAAFREKRPPTFKGR